MVALDGGGEKLLLRPANVVRSADAASSATGDSDGASGGGAGGSSSGETPRGGPSEDTVLLMLESMWRVRCVDARPSATTSDPATRF